VADRSGEDDAGGRGAITGIAMVFRGSDALGTIQYAFTLHDDGRVTGTVGHVDQLLFQGARDVPTDVLPQSVIETNLYLRLSDGTAVDFRMADATGRIKNGRRRQE
jgi:hypothetical protein